MNNKAQISVLAFMLALVIVLLALAFAPSVNLFSTEAQNLTNSIGEAGGMNCAETTDDFVKAGCWTLDLTQVLFIGGLIALAGVIISAKIIFG